MADVADVRAVFVLGLAPSRRLRRLWSELVELAQAAGGGRLNVEQLGWRDALPPGPTPGLMVGHSFGGSWCVGQLARLGESGERVGHLVLLDPVPARGWGALDRTSFALPGNVGSAACFLRRRTWGMPPFSHPIRRAECPHFNRRLGLAHDGIVGRPEVRGHVADAARRLVAGERP